MVVVVDASTAIAWVMRDEASPEAQAALAAVVEEGAVVPALWHWEVANVLLANMRRGRIPRESVHWALSMMASLPVRCDDGVPHGVATSVLPLAERTGLTVYDASYLELAIRREARLATLDDALAKAARDHGVVVVARAA